MYDHIIVPVDFDHEALVTQGLQVAKRLLNDGGKVTFVHVLEEIPAIVVSSLPAGTMDKRKQTAQDQLNTLAEAHGATILAAPRDKPHGLREAYILCDNGYAWVPSRAKDADA